MEGSKISLDRILKGHSEILKGQTEITTDKKFVNLEIRGRDMVNINYNNNIWTRCQNTSVILFLFTPKY
jgi:hypothetical protein